MQIPLHQEHRLFLFAELFLKHPFTNVRCAILQMDTLGLTRVQPPDSMDVDKVNFLEVQKYRRCNPSDFSTHLLEVRKSKFTGQAKSGLALLTNAYDFQRQCRRPNPNPFVRDARIGPSEMCCRDWV
jgi:hypothetical protein